MVIDNLNLEGIASLPTKYNPPLIIYTDRVVALPVTSKHLNAHQVDVLVPVTPALSVKRMASSMFMSRGHTALRGISTA